MMRRFNSRAQDASLWRNAAGDMRTTSSTLQRFSSFWPDDVAGDEVHHVVHALGVVRRNLGTHARDVEHGLITSGADLEHRQAGIERALAEVVQCRTQVGVAGQDDARQRHAVEGGERRGDDDIIAVGRHDEQRARERRRDGCGKPSARRAPRNRRGGWPCLRLRRSPAFRWRATSEVRKDCSVLLDGNGSEQLEAAALEERTTGQQTFHRGGRFFRRGDFRALAIGGRVHDRNQAGLGFLAAPADLVDDAADEFRVVDAAIKRGEGFHLAFEFLRAFLAEGGDEDDFRIEAAGHHAVQAVVERAALGRQQAFDDHDIGILAGLADFFDHALHQIVDALLADVVVGLLDRNRFRRGFAHRRLDETARTDRSRRWSCGSG